MKINQWLNAGTKKLEAAGIGSARLDCLILLEDYLGKDRSHILAHQDEDIKNTKNLDEKIARRTKHEPLAYIRGFTEFYGRKFIIDKDVLEPRPESETMVELLKELVDSKQSTVNSQTVIVDVGTGSGALGITAKLEFPNAKVIATDIDEKCLKVARVNAKSLKTDIDFLQGDLLKPLSALSFKPSAILANLPYVPDTYKINEAAAMEPRLAIFGGPDGLDLYRQLFEQINKLANKPKYILTESLPPQHKKLEKIAKQSEYSLHNTHDFIQVFTAR